MEAASSRFNSIDVILIGDTDAGNVTDVFFIGIGIAAEPDAGQGMA